MTIMLRPCTRDDADAIGTLAAEFHAHLRALGDTAEFRWGAAEYLRDGFGEAPAFEGVVAEANGRVVGYALFHFGYDSNVGQRYAYLIDLFVSQRARRGGVATALMQWVARAGRGRGAELVAWSVHRANHAAIAFYEGVGARYERDVHIMWCPIEPGGGQVPLG